MSVATLQQFYTTKEAAEELGVSEGFVRQMCNEHDEIGKKHGHVWLLDEADLLRIRALPGFGTGPWSRKKSKKVC
jgi:excisionase family DNA binding protein